MTLIFVRASASFGSYRFEDNDFYQEGYFNGFNFDTTRPSFQNRVSFMEWAIHKPFRDLIEPPFLETIPLVTPDTQFTEASKPSNNFSRPTEYTHQNHAGEVEGKCNSSVQKQRGETNSVQILHVEVRNFDKAGHKKIQNGDYRGVVVEADHGVHLQALAVKHDLRHDNPHSLECETTHLEDKPNDGEFDHASTCNCDTQRNDKNVDDLSDCGVDDAE
ncbi:hypothetical protein HG530_002713 [Fusarium avenaceum]|nr:hypothetical protein HG530_002713 [Fusarium avenaceum]